MKPRSQHSPQSVMKPFNLVNPAMNRLLSCNRSPRRFVVWGAILFIAAFGLTSPTLVKAAGEISSDGPPLSITIENAMRVWQERYQAVMGKDKKIAWPIRKSDGVTPPDFPEDCFYREDLRDDKVAAELVKVLAASVAEVQYDDSHKYIENGELKSYPVPVLSHFIFTPGDGDLEGKSVMTVAHLVFDVPAANMLLMKNVVQGGPFDDITAENYRQKFYEICLFLSITDLPILRSSQPFLGVKTQITKMRMGSSVVKETEGEEAKLEALNAFQTGKEDGAVGYIKDFIGVSVDNIAYKKSIGTIPVVIYKSYILWAAGYYELYASKFGGEFTPYARRADYSTNSDPLAIAKWDNGGKTSVPVFDESLFPESYPNTYTAIPSDTRTVLEGGVLDEIWRSPVYTPQDFSLISNEKVPVATSATPEGAQTDRWGVSVDFLVKRDWKYNLDSFTRADCAICNTCSEACSAGDDADAEDNSVDFAIGLGSNKDGNNGRLKIYSERPNAALASPAGLQRQIGRNVHSVVDYAKSEASARFSTGDVRNHGLSIYSDRPSLSTRPLQQLYTSEWVMDVQVQTPHHYTLGFYRRVEAGAHLSGTGRIDVSGATPYNTYIIENPGDDINKLRITAQNAGGNPRVFLYEYDSVSDGWTLTKGSGAEQKIESVAWKTQGFDRIQRRTIKDASGKVLSVQESRYHTYPWNWATSPVPSDRYELIERVLDPDGEQRTTRFSFYDDKGLDRGGYGKRKSVQNPDGSWERYVYDRNGKLARVVRPFGDSSVDASESQCRVTITQQGEIPDADGDGKVEQITTTIQQALGLEIARSYNVIYSSPQIQGDVTLVKSASIQCQTPDAAWDDADNLVTIQRTYSAGPDSGKIYSVSGPDGTMSVTSYTRTDTTRTTRVESGAADQAGTAVVAGRRSITTVNQAGAVTLSETYDIASGLLIDRSETLPAEFDDHGRALAVHYLDGTKMTSEYNCCGLESQTDRAGTKTTFIYDSLKRQIGTVRAGITEMSILDALGRVQETHRTGSDGSTIILSKNEYTQAGRLKVSADALNRITRFDEVLLPSGRRQSITTFANQAQSIDEYYRDGSLAVRSGSAAHPAKYSYAVASSQHDGRTFNAQITTAIRIGSSGEETEWARTYADMFGCQYKMELPVYEGSGTVSSYQYFNAKNQLVRAVGLDGAATLFVYDAEGRQTESALDANGNGQIDYAGTDRITRTASSVLNDPTHGIVQRTTSSVFMTDGSSEPTAVGTQDVSASSNKSWSSSYGLTTESQTSYEGAGIVRQTARTPDQVVSTTLTKDGRSTERNVVNAAGEILTKQTFGYDAQGRLETATDARNGATTYSYYDDDQVKSVTTPAPDATHPAQTISYQYDALGKVNTTTLPDDSKTFSEYYPTGEVKTEYGSRQYPTAYTYDSQGRVRTLTTWQDFSARTGASVTEWLYHPARGNLTTKKYNGTSSVIYTYTDGGRLRTRKWARGVLTTYAFDPGTGDLSGVTYSDGTPSIIYTQDRAGRPVGLTDSTGHSDWAYEDGQLKTETYTSGLLAGQQLTRGYDTRRLASLKVQAGAATTYQVGYGYLDTAGRETGRLSSVTAGAQTVRYSYEANSMLLAQTTFNQGTALRLRATRSWDHANRLLANTTADANGQPLRSVAYDYNAANQRTKATQEDGEYWKFDYDALGQVTAGSKRLSGGAVIPGYDFGYRFDDIGNRKSTSTNGRLANYTANLLNQYANRDVPRAIDVLGEGLSAAEITVNQVPTVRTTKSAAQRYFYTPYPAKEAGKYDFDIRSKLAGTPEKTFDEQRVAYQAPVKETYIHDADGNLTDDWRWHYTWDAENRLVAMETTAVAASVSVPKQKLEFVYDAMGRRIQKKVSNWSGSAYSLVSDIRFLYDGWNLLTELNGLSGSAVIRGYAWGLDLSGSKQGAGGVGGLLICTNSTAAHASVYDGNGNILGLVDLSNGTRVAEFEYDPFGNTIKAVGISSNAQPFGFSTKYTDTEISLCYYGFRYYNPSTGRWPSRDPIEEKGGVNLYGMVGNDLINDFDPIGQKNFRVGSPTEPPMSFDDDFVFDPTAKATAQDFQAWAKWAARLIGGELIRWDLYDATRAYRHYLEATGADLEIDYEKAYLEDKNILAGVVDEIFAAQVDAERLSAAAGQKFQITGDASRLKSPANENWQKTIGHHWIWGGADVEVCGDQFTMVITIHEKDRYNFNRGKRDIATGLPDNANGRFTELGWAKPFMTYGKLTKKVTWKKGASFTNVNIQDAGR